MKAWTENRIIGILAFHFDFGKNVIVPNYMKGLTNAGEADLLVLRPSDWAEEIEIKISAADFKAEFKHKPTKHTKLTNGKHHCKKYWFAMPLDLALELKKDIPEYAGLLGVNGWKDVRVVKPAPVLKNASKVPAESKDKMMKSIYSRYWNYKWEDLRK